AVILDPELIIYDEPFAGQDSISMGMPASLIARLNKALGLTTIIVSHDVDETAGSADYLKVIADCALRRQGHTEQVIISEDPRGQQFVRSLPDGPVPFHYPAEPLLQDLGLESRA